MDKTTSLVITVLVLGLVVLEQQSQLVHADKSCCPSSSARNVYNVCRLMERSKACASISGCKIVQGATCPDPYIHQQSPYSDSEAANVVLEFCKSGCTSFVCNNTETAALKEGGNDGAVVRCGEACYRFCTNNVVGTATNVAA